MCISFASGVLAAEAATMLMLLGLNREYVIAGAAPGLPAMGAQVMSCVRVPSACEGEWGINPGGRERKSSCNNLPNNSH